MTIHRFCDKEMVIELTWLDPVQWPAAGRERRITRELMELKIGPAGYVELETPSGCQIGASSKPEDLGLESAAALLVQVQQSAVLIEHLENDRYWLCAIEDGAVFPAGDLVGSKDLIEARLKEISSDIAGTSIPIYEKSGTFEIENAMALNFADLIGDASSNSNIEIKPVQFSKLNKSYVAAIAALVVLSSLIGTWQFADHLLGQDTSKQTQELDAQQDFQREKHNIQESLKQNAAALLATFADKVYDRPFRAAGWQAQSYEWENDQISVIWHRQHGNIADITEHLNTQTIEFTERSDALTETIPFPASEHSDPENFEKRLGTQARRVQLLDELASLPGDWVLKPAQSIGKKYRTSRSHLSATSDRLNEIIAAAIGLQEQPVHVTRIKITLGNTFSWELEGEYFASLD